MKNKFLITLSLLPIALATVSFSSAVETKGEDAFSGITIDYSTTDHVAYIDGETLIKQLTNNQASDAEKAFINKNYRLKYDVLDSAPINYGAVSGNYYVEGFEKDGFVPEKVTFKGKDYPFEQVNYQTIATVDADEDITNLSSANVVYSREINLDRYNAEEILNAAYNAGKTEVEKQQSIDEYNEKLVEIQNFEDIILPNYRRYQSDTFQWNANKEKYDEYTSLLAEYNSKKAEYDSYCSDLSDYEQKLANYKSYQDALKAYNANEALRVQAEAQYEVDMAKVKHQLDAMELLFTVFPNVEADGTIYSYINRGAVDQVLVHQEDLTTLGVSYNAIKKAGDDTVLLRNYLDEYDELRKNKTSEVEALKYEFYIKNFSRIKPILISLTQCLEVFFQNGSVRATIEDEGKTQRYIYLIAELIYVSEVFSDTPVKSFDEVYGSNKDHYVLNHEYKINGDTVANILGIDVFDDKSISMKPLSSYPTSPSITYGSKPKLEDYGLESEEAPVRPAYVEEPTRPEEVANPGEAPDYADYGLKSADKPVKPTISNVPEARDLTDETLVSLYNEVKNESLKERTNELTADALTFKVNQTFNIADTGVEELKVAVMWVPTEDQTSAKVHEIAFFTTTPVLKHEIPPTAQGSNYKYFNKWLGNEEISDLETYSGGSISLTADFAVGVLTQYKLVFKDKNGNVLNQNEGYENFRATYKVDDVEVTPTKPSDDDARYEFLNYTYELVDHTFETNERLPRCEYMFSELVSDENVITIVVNFKKILTPTATFVDDSGNQVLYKVEKVDEGTKVNYFGQKPTKDETTTARYEFDYWTVDGEQVSLPYVLTKDTTFKAHFKTINKWSIRFVSEGTLISDKVYEEGSEIVLPETPTKHFTDNCYFEFDGYDKEITTADSNKTYNAKFVSHNIIDDATITRTVDGLTIESTNQNNEINLSKFVELIADGYVVENTTINFDQYILKFTANEVKQFYALGVATLKLNISTSDSDTFVTLVAKDANGVNISGNLTGAVTFKQFNNASHVKAMLDDTYVTTNVIDNRSFSLSVKTNKQYDIFVAYSVKFNDVCDASYKVNGKDVNIFDILTIKEGEEIEIESTSNNEGVVVSVIAINSNSKIVGKTEDNKLTITVNDDIVIYSETKKATYTISLYVDDNLFSQISADSGLTVALPDAFKESSGNTTYIFKYWANENGDPVNSVVLNGNVSLHAVFDETRPPEVEPIKQADVVYSKYAGYIALAGVCVVFVTGLAIAIFAKPKHKKNRKGE